jgi:hypothetical protein
MPARGGGLGHATASGIASGVASALTQTLTAALARELPGGPAVWWQTAMIALAGLRLRGRRAAADQEPPEWSRRPTSGPWWGEDAHDELISGERQI